MKKVLGLLATISLVVASIFSTVACNGHLASEKTDDKFWENNYQYGPKEKFKIKSASNNPYLDYFFGKPEFNYATYLVEGNTFEQTFENEKVKFNGVLENV